MTDRLSAPYKIALSVAKYEADGTLIEETSPHEAWYEPGPNGGTIITDPARIAALEAQSKE